MESENWPAPYEDNRDAVSPQSAQSTKKDSQSDKNYKFRDEETESRSRTRVYHSDPDRDEISDEEDRKSKRSYYSDDYESPSERSLSPYSQSRSQSPSPPRRGQIKRFSSSPPYKTGAAGRRGAPRPQRAERRYVSQQLRRGALSSSKDTSPSKDLDLVTKRMLSARLLKINELRNALTELQQHTNELQKENRILKQLQVRQEKALHRYDDTESEISQLISRHSNETHVLRERLRRTQERERTAERRLKESEEQLHRSQAMTSRLKKLVEQRDLGQRDELTRKLDEEKGLRQEAERTLQKLERNMELSSSSFQRQVASEKKKTTIAQEEVRTLQQELEHLNIKLKDKEKELDAKNIYANSMLKLSQRKDPQSGAKRKLPSGTSTVAVQTEDMLSSGDFPTPPPAITDVCDYDEYLSLKDLNKNPKDVHEQSKQGQTDDENKNTLQMNPGLYVNKESIKTLNDEHEKEVIVNRLSPTDQSEEKSVRPGRVQEEVQRWNQEATGNHHTAEEARRKRDRLLAKMREIDQQNQSPNNHILSKLNLAPRSLSGSPSTPVFPSAQTNDRTNARCDSREQERKRTEGDGGVATALGRRAFRTQLSKDDLAFGNYAPSFGHTASQGFLNFPPTPPKENKVSALEAIGVFSVNKTEPERQMDVERRVEKERKSILMQQLFGNIATTENTKSTTLPSSPPTSGAGSRKEGLQGLHSGQSTPPTSSKRTIQISASRPAVRAITSFDDDIEELVL